jgi:hypothetical protein
MVRVSPPWSARQQRHLAYISEFTTDIRHTPGTENVVADALSRPSEGTAGTGVKTGSCAGILPSGNGVTTVESSSSANVLPGVSSAARPGVTYSDVTNPFVTPLRLVTMLLTLLHMLTLLLLEIKRKMATRTVIVVYTLSLMEL